VLSHAASRLPDRLRRHLRLGGLLHLVRVVKQLDLQIGDWAAPAWVSWIGTVVPAALSFSAFRLAKRH